MKKLFTSILAFIMALSVWAEAPQTISYQAVVRNNVGRLLREKPVGVRITILSGSEDGQVVYSETRTTTTNNNGLLTFAIGDANGVTTDDLSKIAWADNTYFLRCEMDPNGGNTYTLSSTSQMNSVPYALYAKNIAPEALPSWTQSEEKPVYNYTEIVGAPSVPTKVSELQNDANYITLQQVPTVVVPTKVSELQNDANYLTEHQSLADYAKKSELPSTEGLLSAADAVATYQPKGEYLTEHQSLADYAKKSELPSTEGLLSAADAASIYQPKGEYLTEHQSLTDYAKKTDLPTVPTKVSELANDANYVTEGNITTVLNTTNVSELVNDANYATTADVPTKVSQLTNDQGYITAADVPAVSVPTKVSAFENDANYLTEHQSLADYAKKSELPSTEGLLSAADAASIYQPKGEYLTEHQSLTDYAKKTDMPTVPTKVSELTNDANYVTEGNITTVLNTTNVSELVNDANYATTADVPTKVSQLTNDKGYITAAEVPTVSVPTKVSAFENDKNYLTEHQSLADYAKKSELPSTEGLLSAADAAATYQPKGEYLTEHQSLTDYAKKTDLPTVPTKVSELTNDANYVTEGNITTVLNTTNVSELVNDANYATTADVPTKVSQLTNDKGYITAAEVPTVSVPTKVSAFENDKNYLTEHQSLADYVKKSELPTVPTKVSELTNDAGYVTEGSITTVLNTTNVSELVNDANYATTADVPTKVSQLTNDKGYITAAEVPVVTVPTKVSAFENDAKYITKVQFDSLLDVMNQAFEEYNKVIEEQEKVIDSLKEVAANSVQYTLTLTVSPAESGTVSGAGTYTKGKTVTVTATAATGYSFSKWSDGVTTATRSIEMGGDKSLTAVFEKRSYTVSLAASPSSGGTVSGAGTYEYGSMVIIKAEPASGYSFTQWSDGGTMADRIETVTAAISLTATFTKNLVTEGLLPGGFSVSANKQVRFSKGNLQYQASTDTWRFAENQYDVIGDDNKNISSAYSGWIDLFGWGTSGYHDSSDSYNKNYQPYSSSTATVNTTYNYYGYGPSTNQSSPNLTGTSANYDWGVYNAISNGGNKDGVWRTLTDVEWNYLINERTNASKLRGQAIVNGINGYVLLPDDWTCPAGVTFNSSPSDYVDNDYTVVQWTIMENAGAVFLPAAGARGSSAINYVGSEGFYWSSTYGNLYNAFYFRFDSSHASRTYNNRTGGLSVRLIQE